jgi:glycosyltransferase involved in cell wall biosynthesis
LPVGEAIYDVFVDLSLLQGDATALAGYLDRLAGDSAFVGAVGRVTVAISHLAAPLLAVGGLEIDAVPGQPAVEMLACAFRFATVARRHLAVVLGPAAVSGDVLLQLVDGFDLDPMFGTSQPRFSEAPIDRIWPIPAGHDRAHAVAGIVPASLRRLPAHTITPELPACCLMLRWELLAGAEFPAHGCRAIADALLRLQFRARRQGFRNLVLNRATVPTPFGYSAIYPIPAPEDISGIYRDDPHATPLNELTGLSQSRAESLLSATYPGADGRLRLLVDCRGLLAHHDGTTKCILGFLDGFVRHTNEWDIHVLSSPEAAAYHGLAGRFPQFRCLMDDPRETYAASVLLNQPWEIGHVIRLHERAFAIAFLMLDTIAWDIYPGRMQVQATWRFISQHADGLLYISHFTQARFNRRFPVSPDVAESVVHLSLAQQDYVTSTTPEPLDTGQILVFGNDYIHKHVRLTVETLANAFPFNRITALGLAETPWRNVEALPSGQRSADALHGLIANARIIVFPSFYEGFGLPAVEGLSYGRSVLIRRSALWAEIAGASRLPGRLIEFDDTPSLVENVGRVLAGLPVAELPSGTALQGAPPADWAACAQRIIDILATSLANPNLDRWWTREHALRILD